MWADSALQASLTAGHFACAMLARHRAGGRLFDPFVAVSFAFVVTPWVFASPLGLASCGVAHLLWLVAREVVAPRDPVRSAQPVPPGRGGQAVVPQPARSPASAAGLFVSAPVLAVLDETPEIKTFRIARPEGFHFQPGQFVAVRVNVDGRPHIRCYSLSSAPDVRGYLEISVRRQGLVSTTLHATLRPGAHVAIKRPAGAFVYPSGDDRPLALVAGGIGITPLISMLRHAIAADPARPIVLLYCARREQDLAFLDELRVVAARHPHVKVAITLTQADRVTAFRTGRIDRAMVQQHVAAPEHTIFCICGPQAMIAATQEMLTELAVPSSQIRFERFETSAAAEVLNERPRAAATVAAAHRVTFTHSGLTATTPASQTLLDAAEAHGVAIPSACRAGVCQSCRTRLAEGDVDCRSDMLDADDRAAGFILPCVTWPTTDCALEA